MARIGKIWETSIGCVNWWENGESAICITLIRGKINSSNVGIQLGKRDMNVAQDEGRIVDVNQKYSGVCVYV